ncbi:DUF2924 domain-containing protein [Sphingomonas sp. RB1R13]|uniref:DUF2924 domain-containing protein n=1 Tax=Sphingomonas sp. RB1R13 TaxID=3096159 RepID=UPI002FCC717E
MTPLAQKLVVLADMKPPALRDEWTRVYRSDPPAAFGPDLLARALAYTLQEKTSGGLPSNVAREIRRGVIELGAASVSPDRPRPLQPGTRLSREWHGRTHHVHVLDRGYEYRDEHYRSLTAIARLITGARWSGPRFFGLTGRARG